LNDDKPDEIMQYEEVLKELNDIDEEIRYEMERGKPMPRMNHGRVQSALSGEFRNRYRKQFVSSSEVSMRLADDRLTPDICLYPYTPPDWLNDRNPVTEPPLVAIEIISPSQSVTDMIAKARRYFAGGVRSFWLVQPELRTISVLYDDGSVQTFSTGSVHDRLYDIDIPIADVFDE
jgi:Uma2 family endonuclease